MRNLISPGQLNRIAADPRVRIVDARFDLNDPDWGEAAYSESHLPGAVYVHLDRDLSGPVGEHGGRHPLPSPELLAHRLGELGIGNSHRIVVYDQGNGMFASRFWWLLKFLGHDYVQVLDGGFAAWQEAGLPVSSEAASHAPLRFDYEVQGDMIVDRDYLLEHLNDPAMLLVDARGRKRYLGEEEPIDPVTGHIPGAINLPFTGNLQGSRFLEKSRLRERFRELEGKEEVVVYCGSGVSAAHDILAMAQAGLHGVKLYPGSWSDWSSYRDSPVATGEESQVRES